MTDTLHELIHSLTKSEKRYFKLVAGRDGVGNSHKYIDLFDTLAVMDAFDEKRVQAVMQWENYKSSYSMAKQYLYGKILKSLADFEKKDTVAKRLGEEIVHIRTLMRKGLLHQALKKINKAKRLAYKVEALIDLLVLLRLEQKAVIADQGKIAKQKEVLQLGREIQKTVGGIELMETIRNIHYHFFSILRLKGGVSQTGQMEDLNRLMEELEQLKPGKYSFDYPKLYYYNILNQHLYLKGDFKGSLEALLQSQYLIENHATFQKEFARQYLSTLHNVCNRGFILKDYACCLQALEKIRIIPHLKGELLGRWTESYYLLGGLLILHSGSMAENKAFFQELAGLFIDPQRELSRGFFLELNRLLVMGYIMEGEFRKAIHQIQVLVQDPSHKSIRAYYRLLPVIELLVHYDLGNHDWVEQRLESLIKHHSSEKAFLFEEKCFHFLRALLQCTSASMTQTLSTGFLAEVTALRKSPNEIPVFAFFDFEAWIKAKGTGVSMGDIVRADWSAAGYPAVRLKPY